MTLWQGLCIASPNIGAMVAVRFLVGAFGSSPLTNAGGVIADTFSANQRGLAMSVFASAPFLGPALGPITGGFLTIGTGRWQPVFIFLTVFTGLILLLGAAFCPETYAPVLLRQRAARLSKATGKTYVSRLDAGKSTAFADQMRIALVRPWQLLFREPIVLLLSLYGASPRAPAGCCSTDAGRSGHYLRAAVQLLRGVPGE
jgi:MFS family permease